MKKLMVLLMVFGMAAGIVSAAETIDRTVPAEIDGSTQFNEREAPPALFDQYVETKWLATESTGWVTYKFLDGQAFAINSYAMTSANDAPDRDPKAWTLEGSNDDGASWELVDTQSNVVWLGRFQRQVFNCTNTTPYQMYKLTVTENYGSGIMQIAELELIENGISRTDYGYITWSTQINWGEGGLRAFDGLVDSKWLTAGGQSTGWLQFEFLGDGAYAINGYSITSANDAPGRDPRDWTLQGSFDGENWDILDTVTGHSWQIGADEQRHVKHTFEFKNATAYKYYKLDITANNGDTNLMGFAELQLLERPLPGAAEYVSPANIATEVPVDGTQLEWLAGADPNTGTGVWDEIQGHYVYMGSAPDQMMLLTATPLPVATTTYEPDLLTDLTYYWQVEEATSTDGLTVNDPGDPNNVMGRVWRFSTETSIVEVNPQTPVDTIVHPGQSASFTVLATDPLEGEMQYQWYYEINGEQTALPEGAKYIGVNTDTLVITDVQEADKGQYFASVTNTTGTIVYSKTANLYVKKLLAHWTLDADDYDGENYADVTGLGNDANVLGPPVFADGIVDGDMNPANVVANGAVTTSDPNSTAEAGPFNPSEETGQFSISAWIKRAATDETVSFNTIASKRDGWSASDQSYWQFLAVDNGQLRMQSYGLTSINTAQKLVNVGEWHHAAVTFADGIATLYVDGMPEGVGNFTLADGADATFYIGRNDQLAERFDGTLDDVKAFNYALEPEEVVDLYTLETNEAVCLYGNPVADLDEDCQVNLNDLAIMAQNWLAHGFYPYLP